MSLNIFGDFILIVVVVVVLLRSAACSILCICKRKKLWCKYWWSFSFSSKKDSCLTMSLAHLKSKIVHFNNRLSHGQGLRKFAHSTMESSKRVVETGDVLLTFLCGRIMFSEPCPARSIKIFFILDQTQLRLDNALKIPKEFAAICEIRNFNYCKNLFRSIAFAAEKSSCASFFFFISLVLTTYE